MVKIAIPVVYSCGSSKFIRASIVHKKGYDVGELGEPEILSYAEFRGLTEVTEEESNQVVATYTVDTDLFIEPEGGSRSFNVSYAVGEIIYQTSMMTSNYRLLKLKNDYSPRFVNIPLNEEEETSDVISKNYHEVECIQHVNSDVYPFDKCNPKKLEVLHIHQYKGDLEDMFKRLRDEEGEDALSSLVQLRLTDFSYLLTIAKYINIPHLSHLCLDISIPAGELPRNRLSEELPSLEVDKVVITDMNDFEYVDLERKTSEVYYEGRPIIKFDLDSPLNRVYINPVRRTLFGNRVIGNSQHFWLKLVAESVRGKSARK